MKIISYVSVRFRAFHTDPILGEGRHRHSWRITVWRDGAVWTDGRSPRGALMTLIDAIAPRNVDGDRELPPDLWSNEDIATFLARNAAVLGNVTRVNIDRAGFGVEVTP